MLALDFSCCVATKVRMNQRRINFCVTKIEYINRTNPSSLYRLSDKDTLAILDYVSLLC